MKYVYVSLFLLRNNYLHCKWTEKNNEMKLRKNRKKFCEIHTEHLYLYNIQLLPQQNIFTLHYLNDTWICTFEHMLHKTRRMCVMYVVLIYLFWMIFFGVLFSLQKFVYLFARLILMFNCFSSYYLFADDVICYDICFCFFLLFVCFSTN